ncbi:hypothetical protein [Actinacidiphila soli]|uniref:hypothetical protein n=1 Tax=Actinacidiphila soli TaxID=2487275 RepID=UPI0013E31383|nr:hypothetical protein [Actinacidiphila soli]
MGESIATPRAGPSPDGAVDAERRAGQLKSGLGVLADQAVTGQFGPDVVRDRR